MVDHIERGDLGTDLAVADDVPRNRPPHLGKHRLVASCTFLGLGWAAVDRFWAVLVDGVVGPRGVGVFIFVLGFVLLLRRVDFFEFYCVLEAWVVQEELGHLLLQVEDGVFVA